MNRLKTPVTCEAQRIGVNLCGNRLVMDQCLSIDRSVADGDEAATRELLESYGLIAEGQLKSNCIVIIRESSYQCMSIW